jgi:hypothetical protein
MLSQMMMQVNQATAGRGGEGGSPENSKGQGNDEANQNKAQAARGIGG